MPISFFQRAERDLRARGAGVTAVLGPTNTGKTHLAIERMLAHSSGLIGLPLRLLAREVYNRVVERVGADAVALVTGEEKIKPGNPRFWVATVEAMPRDLDVAFLAVDEIQLATDFERGHVFTDRILHLRGREETLVLGAATMRPIIERLLPGASIVSRPRLSQLTFAGDRKLTRLPRRSAIVGFSAEEVYAIAELIRRQRGGAAVVLGALSPRTRNAQVALYQSGEVDYMVATDAIGMGLNLDVDHIAFASDRKFDGYQYRKLNSSELAQIAGRAGRATRDGTFGTTGRCPPFEPKLAQALESHCFEPVNLVQWRNTDLDFSSVGALQASLAAAPSESTLARAPVAEDVLALDHAAREEAVRAMIRTPADVQRLWDVCEIPDYRKIAPANHAELVLTVYTFLIREGRIDTDWFASQVAQADRVDGDIDTLSTRIAQIRTWTFAANRPDWLVDPEHWQSVTRAVEDKLSDALHERLTERFVDRRTSVLLRRLRDNAALEPQISKDGGVIVEGHPIGFLDGFRFVPDASSGGSEAKALHNAAQKALSGEIAARATRVGEAANEQFVLAGDGTIRWTGAAIGKLLAGDDVLRPRVRVIADEHLTGAPREAVQARLDRWLRAHIEKQLGPLFQLSEAVDVTGIARGLAFQLVEAFGVLDRRRVAEEVKALQQPERANLRKCGVRFGAYHIYVPALLKPVPRSLAIQLWGLFHDATHNAGFDELLHLAGSGRTSIPANRKIDADLYRLVGYGVCGERVVRVDIIERLADLIRPALAWREGAPGPKPAAACAGGGFTVVNSMTSLLGTGGENFASILRSLGYRAEMRPKPAEPRPLAQVSGADQTPADVIAVAAGASPAGNAIMAAPVASEPSSSAGHPRLSVETEVVPCPHDSVASAAEAGAENAPVSAESASSEETAATATTGGVTECNRRAEELRLIEVWRPARAAGRRRGRDRQRGTEKGVSQVEPPAADGSPGDALLDGRTASAVAGEQSRGEALDTAKRRRKSEHGSRRGASGLAGSNRTERGREQLRARPERRKLRERERAPDPDSPFAKLAGLKAKLEADAEEPH